MCSYYDIIVVGGGHAGCEAAAAAARCGSHTLLITMDLSKFAQMSCNPAMGGIAKGQIIREIDALGGYAGIVSDETTLQFRLLNRSKGPAMWSPRSQNDKLKFSERWRYHLERIPKLDFCQDTVISLLLRKSRVEGVKTKIGIIYKSKAVILTNGTFLNGKIFIGKKRMEGGRLGDVSSYFLTEQLVKVGFKNGRLKTGTPVRIDGRNLDFNNMIEQKGDDELRKFSFLPEIKTKLQQKSCWITYTSPEVHNILESGFEQSPLYDGTIKGTGPRYCPSIESKLVTFENKEKHQLFIEPEGETTCEYYVNGFSSSLPWEIQYKALKRIKGLENIKIYRPGYAIEYDYFEPTQLYRTLETKLIKNLYFAGQINGTTGYEEAGAQGIIAGINAHLNVQETEKTFTIGRDEGYIGVLIDDLITKGVDEPYRMFTSRAEYRVLLRQDNADERLTSKGLEIENLIGEERAIIFCEKQNIKNELVDFIEHYSVKPQLINDLLKSLHSAPIKQGQKLKEILLRPEVDLQTLVVNIVPLKEFIDRIKIPELRYREIIESVEIDIKYKGYISREKTIAEKLKRLEHIEIKDFFDYENILTLSIEARQKLKSINPETIGQASRIPGVSPADINVLLIMLGR